jgi:hypothetical protein
VDVGRTVSPELPQPATTSQGAPRPSLRLAEDQPYQRIPDVAKWDPALTERVVSVLRPIAKHYFRSEAHDLGRIPAGGVPERTAAAAQARFAAALSATDGAVLEL